MNKKIISILSPPNQRQSQTDRHKHYDTLPRWEFGGKMMKMKVGQTDR